MSVDEFFSLLLQELQTNRKLWPYYKFLTDPSKLNFRKAYFCQRLQYIKDNVGLKDQIIWDCGCGFGTTGLFLALNGYKVFGTTLEYYFSEIESRRRYWSQFGDVSFFECRYENLFDSNYHNTFDTIIVQDTLHHLEPINEALRLLRVAVKSNGKLLILEENGSNVIQKTKLFLQRGFQKTKSYYDEKLNKEIVLGNERIRSLRQWKLILYKNGFIIDERSVSHIRLLPPLFFKDYDKALLKENKAIKHWLLKKYFYFGINFTSHPLTN